MLKYFKYVQHDVHIINDEIMKLLLSNKIICLKLLLPDAD